MLGQQCWDMLRSNVAIVWPGLNAGDVCDVLGSVGYLDA